MEEGGTLTLSLKSCESPKVPLLTHPKPPCPHLTRRTGAQGLGGWSLGQPVLLAPAPGGSGWLAQGWPLWPPQTAELF